MWLAFNIDNAKKSSIFIQFKSVLRVNLNMRVMTAEMRICIIISDGKSCASKF